MQKLRVSAKQRAVRVLAILAVLLFLPVTIAYAQDGNPRWYQNLHCRHDNEDNNYLPIYEQIYGGVELCVTNLAIEQMGNRQAYVIVVDLYNPGVSLEYVVAEGYDQKHNFGPCSDVNIPDPNLESTGPGCYTNDNHKNWYPVMELQDAAKRFPNTAVVINSD
jgi:hypothetical protein